MFKSVVKQAFVGFFVALVVLLAVISFAMFPTVQAASSAQFVSSVHSIVDGDVMRHTMPVVPFFQGTGECGYSKAVDTLHRNGLVDPRYCTSEPVGAVVKHTNNNVPSITTSIVPVIVPPVVVPPTTPKHHKHTNCNNGAGNGDNCTPGHSSGSNQGQGQQTGDQTNQGEQGNGHSNSHGKGHNNH